MVKMVIGWVSTVVNADNINNKNVAGIKNVYFMS